MRPMGSGSATTAESIEIRRLARGLADRLRGTPGVEAVLLFGSGAHGRAGPGSDCDLALVGTRKGLRAAAGQVPSEAGGRAVQTVALPTEEGFEEYWRVGSIGAEVAWTGMLLWGKEEMIWKHVDKAGPMSVRDVGRRQRRAMMLMRYAVERWGEYRERGGAELLEEAARFSGDAGDYILKSACLYRGFSAATSHKLQDVKDTAVHRGKEAEGPIPCTEEEGLARIGSLKVALNDTIGGQDGDHTLHYKGWEEVKDEETRARDRLVNVLRHGMEETDALKTHMPECANGVAAEEAQIRRSLRAMLSHEGDEEVQEAARVWTRERRNGGSGTMAECRTRARGCGMGLRIVWTNHGLDRFRKFFAYSRTRGSGGEHQPWVDPLQYQGEALEGRRRRAEERSRLQAEADGDGKKGSVVHVGIGNPDTDYVGLHALEDRPGQAAGG